MARLKKRADGRYRKQVYIAPGKYKSFWGTTQKEVEKAAAEYKAAIAKGFVPELESTTFGELIDNLISIKEAQGVGAKTVQGYYHAKKHWESLCSIQAKDLRSTDFQKVLNNLADWHDGKEPLSHRTLALIHGVAKQAYLQAIPEIMQYNPLDRVVTPAGVPAKERLPLEEYQQQWIIDTPHRAQRAAMLMMYSGLRRGEATALTWNDVDLENGTISVNKSYDFESGKTKSTKTAAGVRIVNIPKVLVDYLQSQKDGYLYVLHNEKGQPMTTSAWHKLWSSYMCDLNAKYGHNGKSKCTPGGLPIVIETFTVHQLRHTFCTLLYLAGVDVMTARDQMGHSNITVTMGIYTHLDKKYKRNSMSKLDDYLDTVQTQCKKG